MSWVIGFREGFIVKSSAKQQHGSILSLKILSSLYSGQNVGEPFHARALFKKLNMVSWVRPSENKTYEILKINLKAYHSRKTDQNLLKLNHADM